VTTLKTELLYRGRWPTREAARMAIFEHVEGFYNRRRIHSSLGYRSPVDYERRVECAKLPRRKGDVSALPA
jgi:putative transposase